MVVTHSNFFDTKYKKTIPPLLFHFVLFSFLIGVILVVFRTEIFPPKFFYDGLKIQRIALGQSDSFGDESFGVVANIYRVAGLSSNQLIASICGYGLGVSAILLAIKKSGLEQFATLSLNLLILFSFIFSAVYLGWYSKDVFVLIPVIFLLLLPQSKFNEVILISIFLTYALAMRQYWLLVAVLYVVFRIGLKNRISIQRILSLSLLSIVSLALTFTFTTGLGANNARYLVNRYRSESLDAVTIINQYVFIPEPWAGILNTSLVWIFFMIPLPLLAKFNAYYAAMGLAIGFIWLTNWKAIFRSTKVTKESDVLGRSISLIFAFVIVQALFEPDFGSYLRHLTPLLPLFILVASSGMGSNQSYECLRSTHSKAEGEYS